MLLTARRAFTATSDHLVDDPVLTIEDGRITNLTNRDDTTDPDHVIDLGDVTLLPGLIDIHQHLAFDASTDPVAQLQADDDTVLLERMRRHALSALDVGITTIRDLGDRNYLSLDLRDRYATTEIGPRILASGPPITTPNGHCWFLGGVVEDIDAIGAAVAERAARGVDVIKIMASGGNMTPTVGPHESQFGRPELAAALAAAHAAGLPLAVHAHGGQAVADALAVGADSIEHCTFFSAEGVDADPGVLQALADSSCVISMTAAVVPSAVGIYPAMAQRLAAIYDNCATLHRSGARLVCSSDAGVGPNKPHHALPYGVVNALPALGMTNAEALANVTTIAADACGLGAVTGTLAAGRDADIVAVAGNPLDDLTALHEVVAVFARGRRHR
jgi:imidazolonepropionase-like amidohydrolase